MFKGTVKLLNTVSVPASNIWLTNHQNLEFTYAKCLLTTVITETLINLQPLEHFVAFIYHKN
jgi:hypothetical protein